MVSTLNIPLLIKHPDEDVQRMYEQLRTAILQFAGIPFLFGTKITATLSTTVNKIEHKLGRAYQGVFALDGSELVIDTTNDAPKREVWLTIPSGSKSVDLWVF